MGNLIQAQLMNAHNWPFAAALSVVLLVLTTVILWLYRKLSGVKDLEGSCSLPAKRCKSFPVKPFSKGL